MSRPPLSLIFISFLEPLSILYHTPYSPSHLNPPSPLSIQTTIRTTGIWRQKNVKIKKNVVSFFGADVTSDVGMHVNKGNSLPSFSVNYSPSLFHSHCYPWYSPSLSLSYPRSFISSSFPSLFSFFLTFFLYLSLSLPLTLSRHCHISHLNPTYSLYFSLLHRPSNRCRYG
jgi:hypothetical protein